MKLDKDIHTVWEQIYAGGELKTASDLYDAYSQYLFALDVSGLSENATVYARAYVKLQDETVVYGDLREVQIVTQ